MTESTPAPRDAWIPHVLPFVAWIFFMQLLGDPAGWKYAVRAAAGLALLFALRPWRWNYPPLRLRNLPMATLVGVAVFAFWIAPETDVFSRFETFHRGYLRFGIQMPWETAPPLERVRYAPETDGLFFTLTRFLGSAVVIAIIEEFFWRSWLTRWIDKENFLEADPGTVSNKAVVISALMFSTVHTRWIAGIFCGLLYGWYYRKTRDIWAVSYAHGLTNALLGAYVLWSGKFEFWA